MRSVSRFLLVIVVVVAALVVPNVRITISTSAAPADEAVRRAPAGFMAMQVGGRGRIEAPGGMDPHGTFAIDGARFQGRFVIYSIDGDGEPIFGDDTSLFDADCVAKFGRGPQCAYFVGVLNGMILEAFDTGEPGFVGNLVGRTGPTAGPPGQGERLRIFFDPHPDGTRNFEDLRSFEKGEVIARYKVSEFFQIDFRAGIFNSRGNYSLIESKPVTFADRTVDFKDIAARITQIWHAHQPEPDPEPDSIPTDQEPYGAKGPGKFDLRFPIGGMLMNAG
ncbi:MAG TPA: hypothetical protein VG034_18135 [Acidimicrobiia bacterium]|nr:hypothetical protein [Acidimicrobiia bacterium]